MKIRQNFLTKCLSLTGANFASFQLGLKVNASTSLENQNLQEALNNAIAQHSVESQNLVNLQQNLAATRDGINTARMLLGVAFQEERQHFVLLGRSLSTNMQFLQQELNKAQERVLENQLKIQQLTIELQRNESRVIGHLDVKLNANAYTGLKFHYNDRGSFGLLAITDIDRQHGLTNPRLMLVGELSFGGSKVRKMTESIVTLGFDNFDKQIEKGLSFHRGIEATLKSDSFEGSAFGDATFNIPLSNRIKKFAQENQTTKHFTSISSTLESDEQIVSSSNLLLANISSNFEFQCEDQKPFGLDVDFTLFTHSLVTILFSWNSLISVVVGFAGGIVLIWCLDAFNKTDAHWVKTFLTTANRKLYMFYPYASILFLGNMGFNKIFNRPSNQRWALFNGITIKNSDLKIPLKRELSSKIDNLGKLALLVAVYGPIGTWIIVSLWQAFTLYKFSTFLVLGSTFFTYASDPVFIIRAMLTIGSAILTQNFVRSQIQSSTSVPKESKNSEKSCPHSCLYDDILLEYDPDESCFCATWLGLL